MTEKREARIRARDSRQSEGRSTGQERTDWEEAKANIENGIAASGGTGQSIPFGLGVKDIPKHKEGPSAPDDPEDEED